MLDMGHIWGDCGEDDHYGVVKKPDLACSRYFFFQTRQIDSVVRRIHNPTKWKKGRVEIREMSNTL